MLKLQSELFEYQNFVWNLLTSFRVYIQGCTYFAKNTNYSTHTIYCHSVNEDLKANDT